MKHTLLVTLLSGLLATQVLAQNTSGSTPVKTKVIAHRGAWKEAGLPQNSIAALQEAIRLGCDGSEFDVHLTADDSLVITHDNDFFGKVIEEHTYAELVEKRLSNGESLPTLHAYLTEGMKQKGTHLFLEVKSSKDKARTVRTAEKTVAMVHQLGARAWVDYIAFDYDALLRIRALDPATSLAYLNGDRSPDQLMKDGISGFDYHHNVLKKNMQWIKEAQALKLTTNVWTVNTEELMEWSLAQGLDYITTDEPACLQSLISKSVHP